MRRWIVLSKSASISSLMTFLIAAGLFSCTVYSSAGRKDFETKSPNYVKTLAFVGCDPIEQKDFDEGFLESFSARSFYSTDNFWVAEDLSTANPVVQVVDHKHEKICTYQYNDSTEWQANKAYFLKHLQ